jgi:hypothetical protein
MSPTKRSSTSKPPPTLDSTSTPSDTTIVDEVPTLDGSIPIDDYDVLATVMDSIKAANRAIDAISLRLTAQTASIDSNTKLIAILDDTVMELGTTVNAFPKTFDTKITTIQENLRSEFSHSLNSFGNKFLQDLSAQREGTELCFKSHASTIATIADDVLAISKNLTALQ